MSSNSEPAKPAWLENLIILHSLRCEWLWGYWRLTLMSDYDREILVLGQPRAVVRPGDGYDKWERSSLGDLLGGR